MEIWETGNRLPFSFWIEPPTPLMQADHEADFFQNFGVCAWAMPAYFFTGARDYLRLVGAGGT